jgi:hypothetical protein
MNQYVTSGADALTECRKSVREFINELKRRGWMAETFIHGAHADFPDGCSSSEWRPEFYDLARRYFGRWGWKMSEAPDGSLFLTVDYLRDYNLKSEKK